MPPDGLHFAEDNSQRRRHCFRVAALPVLPLFLIVLGTTSCFVAAASGGLFAPLVFFSQNIIDRTMATCSSSVEIQDQLIGRLVYNNITQAMMTTMLTRIAQAISDEIKVTADRAVDAVWGTMKMYNMAQPDWNGTGVTGRLQIANAALVEIERQWLPSEVPMLRGLFVSFDEPFEYLGVTAETKSSGAASGSLFGAASVWLWDGPAASEGIDPSRRELNMSSGDRQGRISASNHSALDFGRAGLGLAAAAQSESMKVSADARSMRTWSRLEERAGDLIAAWTAPVSYCGSYVCKIGQVAAEMSIASGMRQVCGEVLADLQETLALLQHPVTLDHRSSGIFIIHQQLHEAPHVIATSSPLESSTSLLQSISRASLLMADGPLQDESPRPFWTFLRSAIDLQIPELVACDAVFQGSFTDDCMEVASLAVSLDASTSWLILLVLPAGVFGSDAESRKSEADSKVEEAQATSRKSVNQAFATAALVLAALCGASFLVSVVVTRMATVPLRKLAQLMRRLGDLDFAEDSHALKRLLEGRRSVISDVHQLQSSFCVLYSSTQTFARFVPETVVRNIVKGEANATQLHVVRKEVTIMCTDIAGFTTICESLKQRELLFVLTRYFSVMTRVIELYEGVVSEILGDGLLVFWNSPADVEHHAAKACAAGLAQHQALVMLNAELAMMELPLLAIRIGIHTGETVTGNIGSAKSMKFGCLGVARQIAAQLEDLCKHYDAGIICSENTFQQLPAESGFFTRKLDLLELGSEQIFIHEVMGRDIYPSTPSNEDNEAGQNQADSDVGFTRQHTHLIYPSAEKISKDVVTARQRKCAQLYEDALEAFLAGRYVEAQEQALALLVEFNDDVASQQLLRRCSEAVKANFPGAEEGDIDVVTSL